VLVNVALRVPLHPRYNRSDMELTLFSLNLFSMNGVGAPGHISMYGWRDYWKT
jgi:hypothetical protein